MSAPPVPVNAFAAVLRDDPRSLNADGHRVDWDDGPWPVKVYDGADRQPLLGSPDPVARLLSLSFAAHRVRFDPAGGLPVTPDDPHPERHGPRFVTRRPIASGGAMYPTEVYVLLAGPDTVHHYDPWRHELVDLRHPAPGQHLLAALGLEPDERLPPVTILLASRFWKNIYKYGDFGYRLGAVDLGVGLGRLLAVGAAEFGTADVRVDFADEIVDAALGLDPMTESVYAIAGLGEPSPYDPPMADGAPLVPRPPPVLERSRRQRRSARFDGMHRATLRKTVVPQRFETSDSGRPSVAVAPATAAAMAARTSNGKLFSGESAPADAFTAVVGQVAAALVELRRVTRGRLGDGVDVLAAVHRTDGMTPGWYRGPTLIREDGDCAVTLHAALFARTANLDLAAFTLHIAGPLGLRSPRDYREIQLAAGVAVDAATVAAAARGLGSHPFLGFDAPRLDRAYHLPAGTGVLAQIAVGRTRPDTAIEISVRLA
jgi:SagB-type dehydrogenase family enzyme